MRGVGVCETVFGYTKLTAMAEEKKKKRVFAELVDDFHDLMILYLARC